MVEKYDFFVLEVVAAWIDPTLKSPRTIHHRGRGVFVVAGRTRKLPSRSRRGRHRPGAQRVRPGPASRAGLAPPAPLR